MYDKAGVNNVLDFYKEKFAHAINFDFADRQLDFYNIDYFKRFWMFAKIKENSNVLDFGCGSGTLAILKHKGCKLYGVDFSQKALDIAMQINGYDHVYCGEIDDCAFPEGSFDYVVSLDVFGHIPFEQKDATVARLKTFLKPNGIMLHGIECGDVAYDEMSPQELSRFIQVDGHVGIEKKMAILQRFKRFFKHARGEIRYDLINSVEEYIYQNNQYELSLEPLLSTFLRSLNSTEREVFNISAGLVTLNLERNRIASNPDNAGFLFLEASDMPLPECDFTFFQNQKTNEQQLISDNNIFLRGWYGSEYNEKEDVYLRWGAKESYLRFNCLKGRHVNFSVFSHFPRIFDIPVEILLLCLDGQETLIDKITLYSHQPMEISFPIDSDDVLLKIYVTTTWIPKYTIASADNRELGIGIKWIYLT